MTDGVVAILNIAPNGYFSSPISRWLLLPGLFTPIEGVNSPWRQVITVHWNSERPVIQ